MNVVFDFPISPVWEGTYSATTAYMRGSTVKHSGNVYYALVDVAAGAATPDPTTGQDTWLLISQGVFVSAPNGSILYHDGTRLVQLDAINDSVLTVGSGGVPVFTARSSLSAITVKPYENPISSMPIMSRPYQNTSMAVISAGRLIIVGSSFVGEVGDDFGDNTEYRQITPLEMPVLEGEVEFAKVFNGVGCWFSIGSDASQVYALGTDGGRFGNGSVAIDQVLYPKRIEYFNTNNIEIGEIITFNSWSPRYLDDNAVTDMSGHITTATQLSTTGASSRFLIAYFLEPSGQRRLFIGTGAETMSAGFLDLGVSNDGNIADSGLSNITHIGVFTHNSSVYVIQNNRVVMELSASLNAAVTVATFTSNIAHHDVWYSVNDGEGGLGGQDETMVVVLSNGECHAIRRNPRTGDAIDDGSTEQITPPNGKTFSRVITCGADGRTLVAIMTDGTAYWTGDPEPLGFSGIARQAGWVLFSFPAGVGTAVQVKAMPRFSGVNAVNVNTGVHFLDSNGALIYIGLNPSLAGSHNNLATTVSQPDLLNGTDLRFYALTGYVGMVEDWDYIYPSRLIRIYTTDGYLYLSQSRETLQGRINDNSSRFVTGHFVQTEIRSRAEPTSTFSTSGQGGMGGISHSVIQIPLPKNIILR